MTTATVPSWPWTLPEDCILDPIAIELAARGIRPVALTPAERLTAAARILARGGTPALISRRLRVSGTTALILTARIQHSRTGAAR